MDAALRTKGGHQVAMARPRKEVDVVEVVKLRKSGLGWPLIARKLHLGQGTVFRAFQAATATLGPFQNPPESLSTQQGELSAAEPPSAVE
jgi:hypothetical protein